MSGCQHTSWLSLCKDEQVALRQTSVLCNIVAELETPAQKYPSLVVLTGDLDHGGSLQLQLDIDTAFTEFPVFKASGCIDSFDRTGSQPATAPCHTHDTRELPWLGVSSEHTASALFGRLLQPFAQLVCFFISEGEDAQYTANRLSDWGTAHGDAGQQPRLLVIAAAGETRSSADILGELTRTFQEHHNQHMISLVPYICVHGRHDRQMLQDRISSELSRSRDTCMRRRTLLNAVHFESLFNRACDHLTTSGSDPFNMLVASRLHRPIPPSLGEHVADLLTSVHSYEELTEFAAPFIAECLRLDSYTYDVHGKYCLLCATEHF
jgi:hypothetical protein